jgi:hypothetical protein
VDQIREVFIHSLHKSTQRASAHFRIPTTTAWRVLHKTLKFKAYKLQLLQTLSEEDQVRCENFIVHLEEDETLNTYLIFSDETTLHLCGIIKNQNVPDWGVKIFMPVWSL